MPSFRERLFLRATAPAIEPITLTEAKLYLRVDNTLEDTLISDLIVSARMSAEYFLKSSLITQAWKIAFDDYLSPEEYLPMGPVIGIASVIIQNRNGSMQTIDSSLYYLNAAKNRLLMDSPLFALSIGNGSRIEVTYNTGYGDASAVPKPIKQGMLAHIAVMYDNRGASMARDHGEALAMALPQQTIHLYSPFREVRL